MRQAPRVDAETLAADDRDETPLERLDRNWNEILQELRVTQTGIQILTGFLLTVPFQSRFTELTSDQRVLYLCLVVLAAVTTGLMVAPVSLHRWLFRRRAKSTLVAGADRLMRIALVFLAVVVAGVVLLVFDVVVSRGPALAASASVLLFLVAAWFVLPTVLSRAERPTGTDPAVPDPELPDPAVPEEPSEPQRPASTRESSTGPGRPRK